MGPLAVEIAHAFTDAARRRGERYARTGRVDVVEAGRDFVVAIVQGTEAYETSIRFGKDGCDTSCTCPASEGGPCKHIWALLVVCERDGLLDLGRPTLRPRAREWRERIAEVARQLADDRGTAPPTSGHRLLYGLYF
jgi:uncharacterized Zn finger protein